MPTLPEIRVPHEPFVALEHINLASSAWSPKHEAFWIGCLGAVSDPRASQVLTKSGLVASGLQWVNLGLQQFHIPIGEEGEREQILRGTICLDYAQEELPRLRLRLQSAGLAVSVTSSKVKGNGSPSLAFRGPNGNAFVASGIDRPTFLGPLPSMCPHTSPCLPGGRSVGLGIRSIDFALPHGTADIVAAFYQKLFGADVNRPSPMLVQVRIGQHQSLQFHEIGAGEIMPEYDGHHIALYTNSFPELYERASDLDAVYENPRFPHLTYGSLKDALRHNEFRVRDITDPATGSVVFSLEHEIRSLAHPGFAATLRAVISQDPSAIESRSSVVQEKKAAR